MLRVYLGRRVVVVRISVELALRELCPQMMRARLAAALLSDQAKGNLYKLTVCINTNDATVGAMHLAIATKVAPTVASKSSSQVWIEPPTGF